MRIFFFLSIVYNKITRANLIPLVGGLFCFVSFGVLSYLVTIHQPIDQLITRCSISPPLFLSFFSSFFPFGSIERENKRRTQTIYKKRLASLCVCVHSTPSQRRKLVFPMGENKTKQNKTINGWMNFLPHTHHSVSGGGCLQLLQPQPPPHRERTPPPSFLLLCHSGTKRKRGPTYTSVPASHLPRSSDWARLGLSRRSSV